MVLGDMLCFFIISFIAAVGISFCTYLFLISFADFYNLGATPARPVLYRFVFENIVDMYRPFSFPIVSFNLSLEHPQFLEYIGIATIMNIYDFVDGLMNILLLNVPAVNLVESYRNWGFVLALAPSLWYLLLLVLIGIMFILSAIKAPVYEILKWFYLHDKGSAIAMTGLTLLLFGIAGLLL